MKTIFTLSLLTLLALPAAASDAEQYKMAVIKDSIGAGSIKAGNYQQGVESINQAQNDKDVYQQIANAMNLCVAYANLQQVSNAQDACDQAIYLVKQADLGRAESTNIRSLALNNRAIFKAKIKDYKGALADLLSAMTADGSEVHKSKLIEANLLQLIQKQSAQIQFKS